MNVVKSIKENLLYIGEFLLFIILMSLFIHHFMEQKSKNDAIDEEIGKVTKNVVCAEIGSMGAFGYHKGVEGAKLCQDALDDRKFYKNDRVRVFKGPKNYDCKATVSGWSFDPDTMKPCYELIKIKCTDSYLDSLIILEENLQKFP